VSTGRTWQESVWNRVWLAMAALLAQQQRTQAIFTYVMVAIAAISLLVGGIGIMNIVLATVMERTREIGVRRSIGARRADIVRRPARRRLRLLPLLADRNHRRVAHHRHTLFGPDRLRRLGRRRRDVRHLSRRESRAHQPHRRAALRVNHRPSGGNEG
jgi:hypothetical protein